MESIVGCHDFRKKRFIFAFAAYRKSDAIFDFVLVNGRSV